MDALFCPQINFILKRGNGIKACLFDEEAKSMIGSLIPLSKFNDSGFFHFDLLSNKNRSKIEGMTCVIILRPESVALLLEELVNPFYSNYIVLLTSQVDPLVLELMANADINSLISEVHEINLDLSKQAPCLYISGSSSYKRNLDGICSSILSLEIDPEILIFNEVSDKLISETKNIVNLAKDVHSRISEYNFPKKGTLIILKRNFDLITPLIQDWHYISMINDYLGIKDSLVKINNRSYRLNDQFSVNNAFNEIATVGDQIKTLVKEVEKNKIEMSHCEDIQEILENKSIAEMHLTIYNEITNFIDQQKLLNFSETQVKILESSDFNISTVFGQFSDSQCLNLLLIYFLKNVKNWQETSKLFPKFRTQLLNFYERNCVINYCYKFSLNKDLDPKLAYTPPIKRILKHVVFNNLKENSFVTLNKNNIGSVKNEVSPILLYIEGGISFTEYREIIQYSKALNVEIILISTQLLNVFSLTEQNILERKE